jgi:hypothetical protein
MKRSGVVHLVGVLIAAFCLLASSPVAAQYKMVSLSDGNGLQVEGTTKSSTATPTKATITANISACLGSLGAFAIEGFSGPPNTTEVFTVTQTVPDVLGFSNSSSGPFTDTIDIAVPLDATGNGESAPFYLNGVGLGQTVVSICNDQQYCVWNQASAIVVNVASVEWEAVNSPLDNNPNAGGGLRIFPDRDTATDTATDKTTVVVKIALSAEHSKAVYLKAFDVDDPSTDNTVVDRDGSGGIDNRGTTSTINRDIGSIAADLVTGPDGVARIYFQVSKQPGDNFRIAGACLLPDRDGLKVSGVGVKDAADQPLPTDRAKISPMLTVWRRLHIEVDTMGPVQGNLAEGSIVGAGKPAKGQTALTLQPLGDRDTAALADIGRFAPGRITIGDVGYPVVAHSKADTITVQGEIASDAIGKSFQLFDDDDFNDNDGANFDGDIGEELTEPDRHLVQYSDKPEENVFAPAYVKPIYDLSNPTPKVPFVLNYADTQYQTLLSYYYAQFDNKANFGNSDFWTAYLLGAYQGILTEDWDGKGDKASLFGVCDNRFGASVFLEPGRLKESTRYASNPSVSLAATTAHELGHLFRNSDTRDGGLMTWPNRRKRATFSDDNLANIRDTVYPGDKPPSDSSPQ